MAARRDATRILRKLVPQTGAPTRCKQIRLISYAAGPSKQASLVDARPSPSQEPLPSSSAIPLQNSDRKKKDTQIKATPLKVIRDSESGMTIIVYSSTVSLTAPKYGLEEEFHFSHIWLRDICNEANSIDKDTRQKSFHTSDIRIPESDASFGILDSATSAELIKNGSNLPTLRLAYSANYPVINAFSAAFSSAPPASTEPHISHIPVSVLLEHAVPDLYSSSHGDVGGTAKPWTAADMTEFPLSAMPPSTEQVQPGRGYDVKDALARPARLPWSSLLGQQGSALDARFALVDGLMRDGIAFVKELPTDKTGDSNDANSDNSPNLARLAEMLGEVRHTLYGSMWNVRSLGASSRNIAYTNLDLGLHMDLCYFQNPPRFQFLHMLRNKVKGGQSIFVDAFKVAEEMWIHHRPLWQALTEVPVGFHYQNDGRHYRYTHPTFELAPNHSGHAAASIPSSIADNKMPRLTAINYSPPFQSPLPLHPGISIERQAIFFEALQLFSKMTLEEKYRYERTMVEGEAVVFDNRRVLHSRRGFEWNEEEEQGDDGVKRWLKGCYVDGDAVWSTYRTLRARSQGGKLGLL